MGISGLDDFLWAAGLIGHCALFAILLGKQRFHSFPVFSALIGFNILRTGLLFGIRGHYGDVLYSHTYWTLAIMDAGLQFALIVEVAGKVFRPQGRWAIDVRNKLLFWLILSVTIAAVLAHLQHPVGDDIFQVRALKIGYFSVILNAELFAGMIALSAEAGLNWKSHVASIAMGMAIFSFVNVVIELISRYGEAQTLHELLMFLTTIRRWLYLACELYWGYSLLQPEPSPRKMSPRMEGQISALHEAVIKRNRGWSE
jgi:hypothetical protein